VHTPLGEYTKQKKGGAGVFFVAQGPPHGRGPSLLRGAARLGTGHKAKRRRAWALVL
jgi:hypothetical protein